MFVKQILVAVIAIACLQTQAEASSYSEAINAIENVRKAVDKAADVALQITEFDLVKLQLARGSQENLELRYQMYFDVIEELKKTALRNNIDATKCLGTVGNLTENYSAVKQFLDANCLDGNDTSLEDLTNAVISLRSNRGAPLTLLTELSKCKMQTDCIEKIVAKAKETVQLTQSTVDSITKNELLVYHSTSKSPDCQSTIEEGLSSAVDQSKTIVDCLTALVFA